MTILISRRRVLGGALSAAAAAATTSLVAARAFAAGGGGGGSVEGGTGTGTVAADAGVAAHADEIEDALGEVARARASLRTLSGPFTQERTIGLLATKVRSNGTLTLVRPDRLRWELAPPDEVVYWVGPEGLAYKSARARGRVPIGGASGTSGAKLAAALDDIRILLGGDLGKLRERYDLHLVSRNADGLSFEGTPRPGTGTRLDKLAFALDKDRVRPTRATLVEGPRDKTEIVFFNLERDLAVDPARMRAPF